MKYNLPCDVVIDLLPSYADGLTSESVSKSVKAHIDSCDRCKKAYQNMIEPSVEPELAQLDDKAALKKAKKKIRKTFTCIVAVVAVVVTALSFSAATLIYKNGDVIKSKDISAVVEEIPFDDISFGKDKNKNGTLDSFKFNGEKYTVSKDEYNNIKKYGKIQYVRLPSKISSDSMSMNEVELDGEYICVVSVYADGKSQNENASRNGWNWLQYQRPYDKIVYCICDNNDSMSKKYKILWEKNKTKSAAEIAELYEKKIKSDSDKYTSGYVWQSYMPVGKSNSYAAIRCIREENDVTHKDEYSICLKPKTDDEKLGYRGYFVDYAKAVNGKIDYSDAVGEVFSYKGEAYYYSFVPQSCDYVLLDGQKINSETAQFKYNDDTIKIKYVFGAIENKSGKGESTDGRVVLHDVGGKEYKK